MGTDLDLVGLRKDGSRVPLDIALSFMDTGDGRIVIAAVRDVTPYRRAETERRRADRLLDGTVLTVSVGVSPIRDDTGAVVGISTTARDVSQAKRAFEAARSMMEASLDSLVAISPDGKITDANEATVRLTGVPRETLIGTSFSRYFTDSKKAEAIYQRVLVEGAAVDYQLTLRHRDGHETYTEVLYNASVYRDPRGNALWVPRSACGRGRSDDDDATAVHAHAAAVVVGAYRQPG